MNENANNETSGQDGSETPATEPFKAFVLRGVSLSPMPAADGDPPESRLGDRLKEARQQLELSVEALSRLTKTYDAHGGKGISPPTLARYESGDTTPNVRELRLLGESLGVPVQWLVDGGLPDQPKGQREAQELLAALNSYIRFVQATPDLGSLDMMSWQADKRRAQAIEDAKRPGTKG
jgi:transcriptional regulator with XRE-family HTH domain